MNDAAPSEIPLIVDDGICKTSYPVPPDTIVELQINPDTGDGFAILDDGTETKITKDLIKVVKQHFPDVHMRERFSLKRLIRSL